MQRAATKKKIEKWSSHSPEPSLAHAKRFALTIGIDRGLPFREKGLARYLAERGITTSGQVPRKYTFLRERASKDSTQPVRGNGAAPKIGSNSDPTRNLLQPQSETLPRFHFYLLIRLTANGSCTPKTVLHPSGARSRLREAWCFSPLTSTPVGNDNDSVFSQGCRLSGVHATKSL